MKIEMKIEMKKKIDRTHNGLHSSAKTQNDQHLKDYK
jgi:hypothetical protein